MATLNGVKTTLYGQFSLVHPIPLAADNLRAVSTWTDDEPVDDANAHVLLFDPSIFLPDRSASL